VSHCFIVEITDTNIILASRAPDTAPIKGKMLYAGSKDSLTRALEGVSTKVQATDLSELTEEILAEACRRFA
jgi:cofilin